MSIRELPKAAWLAILRWTAILMLASVAISVLVAHLVLSSFAQGLSGPGLAASIGLPLLLGGPTSFWHLVRLKQLQLANQKLEILASTDWLTSCLNSRAFTDRASAHLDGAGTPFSGPRGALLIIDADNFKLINDLFGHDCGDEALRLVAELIKSKVREGDLVGRMGGEEFGVFLKGAEPETARLVAERIRNAVATTGFAPDGMSHPLSVSVGGAVFDGQIAFSQLFRLADQKLYQAKQSGRNRVEIGHAGDHLEIRLTVSRPAPGPRPTERLAEAG